MQQSDFSPLLRPVIELAQQAGEKILEVYGTEFSVDIKQDRSPLTTADLASHHSIVAGLKGLSPSFPLISEESAELPFSERSAWQTYWLIDPLDGTKEFIKRNGEFTVNIALIHQQRPVLGVVYVPVSGLCYFACDGEGAFKQQLGSSDAVPIRASSHAEVPLRVVGSRSHQGEELSSYLAQLGEHRMVPMGSSIKLCLVADGSADLYPRIGLTSEWDTAAAHCVVEQAGGYLCSIDGEPLLYNSKESYLNPYFLVYGDNSREWTSYLKG